MGEFFETIPPNIIEWIKKQHIFWVATAPLSAEGHVNVSPKGLQDSFHIIDEKTVWYEDLSGSGVETISHLRENGRITVMFSAFEGPPRIVRLFGRGRVHEFGTPEYNALIPVDTHKIGSRSVIVVDVYQVGSSCGYAVPYYEYKSNRTGLLDYYKRVEDGKTKVIQDVESSKYPDAEQYGMKAYWTKKNLSSLDGLPGIQTAHKLDFDPKSAYSVEECAGVNGKSPRRDGKVKTVTQGSQVIDSQNLKLIAAFALGMLLTATSVRLVRYL